VSAGVTGKDGFMPDRSDFNNPQTWMIDIAK